MKNGNKWADTVKLKLCAAGGYTITGKIRPLLKRPPEKPPLKGVASEFS